MSKFGDYNLDYMYEQIMTCVYEVGFDETMDAIADTIKEIYSKKELHKAIENL